MSDLVKGEGGEWRRKVYIVYHDGSEMAAFLSHDAVMAFVEGVSVLGGCDYDLSIQAFTQSLKDAHFLDDSLNLEPLHGGADRTGENDLHMPA
jgi:hypothetical protein